MYMLCASRNPAPARPHRLLASPQLVRQLAAAPSHVAILLPVAALLVPRLVIEEEVKSEAEEGKVVLLEVFRVRRAERVGGRHARDAGELVGVN